MKAEFKPLFEPLTFPSGLEVPNRIIVAPMTTWSSQMDGVIHDDEIAYVARRSKGPGMFMTAACYVHPDGHAFHGQWSCHHDDMIPSLRRVADAIHAEGAKAILQIHHGGRMCPESLLGRQPVCPSAVAALRPDADVPRAMSAEEIDETIRCFGEATRRAIKAGYDGVEIHGANTYLLQQFFSPHSNRRDDEWGGSLENRLRFPLAVMQVVKDAASLASGPFAVGYRLSPEELEEPGITLEDTLVLVDALIELNPDWLHISVRDYWKHSIRDKADERRPSTVIAKHVNGRIPVIGVGLIYSPEQALVPITDGCDAVALGRVVLMEPEWVEKVTAGEEAQIRTALPANNADKTLTLPGPLYKRLLDVKGWIPLSE
jgi:2,4-dienoyl-CoA reductase-like NADH-dependent reductase (Old Yellow Enzyme family)